MANELDKTASPLETLLGIQSALPSKLPPPPPKAEAAAPASSGEAALLPSAAFAGLASAMASELSAGPDATSALIDAMLPLAGSAQVAAAPPKPPLPAATVKHATWQPPDGAAHGLIQPKHAKPRKALATTDVSVF